MDVKSKGQQKVDHFFPPLSLSPLRWVVEIKKTKKKNKKTNSNKKRGKLKRTQKLTQKNVGFFRGERKEEMSFTTTTRRYTGG